MKMTYDEFRADGIERALERAEKVQREERRRGVRRPVRDEQVKRLQKMERERMR